eukprot:620523-Amphidinium_carterae.1
MFASSARMVRKMFLPFYSKDARNKVFWMSPISQVAGGFGVAALPHEFALQERGPPKIRMQVCGTKAKRFYKVCEWCCSEQSEVVQSRTIVLYSSTLNYHA